MHTRSVRTRQQLKNEKSQKYKPKVKYIVPIDKSCHVEKEQELGHDTIRMSCEENEMHEGNEMPCKENETREEYEMVCEQNVVAEMESRGQSKLKLQI